MFKKISQLCGLLCFFVIQPALSASEVNLTQEGVALSGYDALTFFSKNPEKGDKDYNFEYQGNQYFFSSVDNLASFKANPEKYTPQYGGYCAFGVSLGKKFLIDPTAYEIKEDKLYLLLNGATKKVWEKNIDKNIMAANKNWPVIAQIKPAKLDNL